MEPSKAYALLDLQADATEDQVTDALDQAVFKVRDAFLRTPIVPQLSHKRVELCVQWSDVAQTLGVHALGGSVTLPHLLPKGEGIEGLVRGHVENLRRCRNAMATSLDPDSVAQLGNLMLNLQQDYMKHFMKVTEEWSAPEEGEGHVPAREEPDWMALLAAIRAHDESPGSSALLQEMVRKERKRMRAMLSSSFSTSG